MKQIDYILTNEGEVLDFLKSKYPLYHLSNVFFRDIQYGIQTLLFRKRMSVGYADAAKIAREFVGQLEKKKVLTPIDQQSWVLNYPQFKKPMVAPAPSAKPAAKPAGAAAAMPRPAGASPGSAKPALPPLSRPAAGGSPAKPGGLPPLSRPAPAGSPAKPGGLPPLSRPAAGASAKPGGLPPLKSPASSQPAASAASQAEAPKAAAPTEASAPVAASPGGAPVTVTHQPQQPASGQISPGGKRPLPPLSRTPSGPKK